MAVSYGDNIGVSGSSNNFTMISGCGILIDSGISSSSVALVTGSYIVLSLNSNLKNEWLLTAGSGINITNNNSASTVTISTSVSASSVAPTTASYVVLSLNSSLSNEWLLTAGSNVTLTQNASASTITIDTNVSASSVATSGSYVMLALHPNISNEWLLTAGENIAITQNASASTVTLSTIVAASSIAPVTASYVLLDVDGSLQNGLALTAGSNVTIVRNTLSGTVKVNSITSGSNLSAVVPVTLGGGGASTASGIRTNIGLGNMAITNMYNQQVILSSGSWVTKSASVVVTYMTASAIVLYGPEPSTSTNRDAYYNADVYCSAQTTGSLTFNYMSSASPTTDIAVNVMYIV
jgi:hypothetical protein